MTTVKLSLVLLALTMSTAVGCSSAETGADAAPPDALNEVVTFEAAPDAVAPREAGSDAPYVFDSADAPTSEDANLHFEAGDEFVSESSTDSATGFGDSDIVDTESGLARAYVSRAITLAGSYPVEVLPSDGGIPSSAVPTLIASTFFEGGVPNDSDGLYVLFPSKEVGFDPGLACAWYCGFHDSAETTVGRMRYAVVVDTGSCPDACSAFGTSETTPNGNLSADSMVSILAHELAEAATDPDPWTGWSSAFGQEVGDLCVWHFGDVYLDGAGAPYTQEVGGLRVLIQQSWSNSLGCTAGPLGFDAGGPPAADAGLMVDWAPGTGPVYYRGGRVLSDPIRVYFLWLGQWTARSIVEPILSQFVRGLGASGWWNAPAAYFEEPALLDAGLSDGGKEGGE